MPRTIATKIAGDGGGLSADRGVELAHDLVSWEAPTRDGAPLIEPRRPGESLEWHRNALAPRYCSMYVRLGTGCAYFRASAFAPGSRSSHARFSGMAGKLGSAATRRERFTPLHGR